MNLEIVVVILAVGNLVTMFASYMLGRNAGYREGYKTGCEHGAVQQQVRAREQKS